MKFELPARSSGKSDKYIENLPTFESLEKNVMDSISKTLKAFQIIKKMEVLYVFQRPNGDCYICFNNTAIEISQEEYNLLKEML